MAIAVFNKKKALFNNILVLNLRKELAKCCIWSKGWFCAEIGTLRTVHQKYLGGFEMWCWRMMEKITWTDHVRNEEVLHKVKEERNIPHTVKRGRINELVIFCVETAF
jgi:hypothetical protein